MNGLQVGEPSGDIQIRPCVDTKNPASERAAKACLLTEARKVMGPRVLYAECLWHSKRLVPNNPIRQSSPKNPRQALSLALRYGTVIRQSNLLGSWFHDGGGGRACIVQYYTKRLRAKAKKALGKRPACKHLANILENLWCREVSLCLRCPTRMYDLPSAVT